MFKNNDKMVICSIFYFFEAIFKSNDPMFFLMKMWLCVSSFESLCFRWVINIQKVLF